MKNYGQNQGVKENGTGVGVAAGYSQKKIAELAGAKSQGYVSQWENGECGSGLGREKGGDVIGKSGLIEQLQKLPNECPLWVDVSNYYFGGQIPGEHDIMLTWKK